MAQSPQDKQRHAILSALDVLIENDADFTAFLQEWAARKGMANVIGSKLDNGIFKNGLAALKIALLGE